MKKDFITIKFVCSKTDERKQLLRVKRDLPLALLMAQRDPSFDGHTYHDPFLPENTNKVGYVIRVRKEMISPRDSDIETHETVFSKNEIKNMIDKLWEKYQVVRRNRSIDFSYAATKMDDFVQDLRNIFCKLKLKKELWEDFFYFALGDEQRSSKYQVTPEVNAVPMIRVENGKIEFRIDLDKSTRRDEIIKQFSAFTSLAKEFCNVKYDRKKGAILKYQKINETLDIEKSLHVYEDPDTGEQIAQDAMIDEKIEKVLGKNNDADNSKQISRLKKLEQRLKKIGQ